MSCKSAHVITISIRMFKPEDNYHRIYRITYAKKETVYVPGGQHYVRRWDTHCMTHVCCPSSFIAPTDLSPFELATRTSARVCRGFTFGWNGNWRARACTRTHTRGTRDATASAPDFAETQRREISDRSTIVADVIRAHLNDSFDNPAHHVRDCTKRPFLRGCMACCLS